jgi:hypothetical protein
VDHQEESEQSESNGEPIKEPRKRKRIAPRVSMGNIIEDPMALTENKSSVKARKVFTDNENITIELWFGKHYLDRDQHGDDWGKREGIDNDTVEDLVKRSVKHMILYSTFVKGFTFLNRNVQRHERSTRIVLQEQVDLGLLNVVIEAHYLDINKYEITVVTAMCKNDYVPSDNQYVIELMVRF